MLSILYRLSQKEQLFVGAYLLSSSSCKAQKQARILWSPQKMVLLLIILSQLLMLSSFDSHHLKEKKYSISQGIVQKQEPEVFYKKRLWHRCFLVNFAKFLRTPFLQNTSGWLLLIVANFAFLYHLKTSKNHRFSDVFRRYRNVTLD